jgi:hypothetical protein
VLLFSPPIPAAASALLVFRRSFPTRLIVFLASLARLCPAVGYQTLVSIKKKSNVFLFTYKHPQERYPSGEKGEKTILRCRNRNPNSLTQLVKFVFGL